MNTEPTSPPSGLASPSCYASSCGRVTLYLGDCLEIAPTLQGVDAIITDPPYGMNLDPKWKKWNGAKQEWNKILGDDEKFDPSPWLAWEKVCMWGATYYSDRLPVGDWLVWDKRCSEQLDKMFGASLEAAWIRGKGTTHVLRMMHGGVVNADSEKGNNAKRMHPTQKPTRLMSWSMEIVGVEESETVLDPYMGSGTTGIACIRTGRRFVGIEKDPAHYATAVERIKRELSQGDLFHSQHNKVLYESHKI